MIWPLDEERQFWRAVCSPYGLRNELGEPVTHPESAWWFLKIAMGYEWYMRDNPHDRWMSRRVHFPIVSWYQEHILEWLGWRRAGLKKRKKLALVIPRRCGKTQISKGIHLWMHLAERNLATAVDSEDIEMAETLLSTPAGALTGDDPWAWFRWLYGDWYDPTNRWSTKRFNHAYRTNQSRRERSFLAVAVRSGATGLGLDVLDMDDLISDEKLLLENGWLDRVNDHYIAMRPSTRADSLTMLEATRYDPRDLIGVYLPREGVRSWRGMPLVDERIEIDPEGEWDVYYLQALDENDESIVPEIHPTEQLHRYRRTHPFKFACQMMNNPASGEHMPMARWQADEAYINRQDLPGGRIRIIVTDDALKNLELMGTGDESVFQLWSYSPAMNGDAFYEQGYGSNKWDLETFCEEIVKLLQMLDLIRPRVLIKGITGERVGGRGAMWHSYLKLRCADVGLLAPPLIELSRGPRSKDSRIDAATPHWIDGHVKIVRNAPGADKLIDQMVLRRKGGSGLIDWADAAADVFHPDVFQPSLVQGIKEDPGPVIVHPFDSWEKEQPMRRYRNPGVIDTLEGWEPG